MNCTNFLLFFFPLFFLAKRLRRKLKSKSALKGIEATFSEFDVQGTGTVTKRHFAKVFKDLDLQLTKGELDKVWLRFDKDNSGVVDFNEFMVRVQKLKIMKMF